MPDDSFRCPCCGGAYAGLLGRSPWRSSALSSAISRRTFMAGGLAAAGLVGAPPFVLAEDEPVTVFSGGTILTVDDVFSEVEAVAVRGKSIIAAGTASDVRTAAGSGATYVDLGGRTMLPGFIDPHTHVVTGAAVDSIMENVGMSRFATVAAVLDRLRAPA